MKKQVMSRQRLMRWRRRKRVQAFDESSVVRRNLLMDAEARDRESTQERPLNFTCEESRR